MIKPLRHKISEQDWYEVMFKKEKYNFLNRIKALELEMKNIKAIMLDIVMDNSQQIEARGEEVTEPGNGENSLNRIIGF